MASRPDAAALVHGAVWRTASLASRVAFLALVVPRTIPGEYGLFFSYSSIGLLLSRVVSFGAIDHLPTRVKGDPAIMGNAVRDLAPLSVVAAGATAAAVASDALVGAAIALALCMASGLMLAGAVRSVGPGWFERWLNLHPILFLLLALLLGEGVTAKQLLVCQSVAILVSQFMLLRIATTNDQVSRTPGARSWLRRFRALLAGGQSRMVSDALIAGCIRGVAIGPVLFGMGAVTDALALALALGEAAWTVGMILVHRNFAYYCSAGPDVRHSVRSAITILVAICAAGLIGAWLVAALHSIPAMQRFEMTSLFAVFVFFAGMAVLSELRYFDVASGKRLAPWLFGQVAFVALAAFSPELLGEFWSVCVLAAVAVGASLALVGFRWRGELGVRRASDR